MGKARYTPKTAVSVRRCAWSVGCHDITDELHPVEPDYGTEFEDICNRALALAGVVDDPEYQLCTLGEDAEIAGKAYRAGTLLVVGMTVEGHGFGVVETDRPDIYDPLKPGELPLILASIRAAIDAGELLVDSGGDPSERLGFDLHEEARLLANVLSVNAVQAAYDVGTAQMRAARWSLDESDATPYGRVLMALCDAVESVLVKRAGRRDQAEDIAVSIY